MIQVQEWVVPELIDSGYESVPHDEGEYMVKDDAPQEEGFPTEDLPSTVMDMGQWVDTVGSFL